MPVFYGFPSEIAENDTCSMPAGAWLPASTTWEVLPGIPASRTGREHGERMGALAKPCQRVFCAGAIRRERCTPVLRRGRPCGPEERFFRGGGQFVMKSVPSLSSPASRASFFRAASAFATRSAINRKSPCDFSQGLDRLAPRDGLEPPT